MRNLPTTQQPDSPPQWLRDTVDITILAALLLAMTLAALV
jgi:hypothetical protein